MRYSETLVKTCTARVLGLPTHSGGKRVGRGGQRSGGWGERGRGGRGHRLFGVICRAGQQKFLWYVFHCMVALAESTTV